MRQFEDTGGYRKINWVDRNNIAVGFDYDSSCCENFGYEFSLTPGGKELKSVNLDNYDFDPEYRNEDIKDVESLEYGLDSGGAVAFRLINPNDLKDILFLTLYNAHNGYYGHGFTVKIPGQKDYEGCL